MLRIRRVFALPSLVVLGLLASLSACSYFTPYRIDVRQGNFVSQTMLAQLSPGMTQEQVRYIMGSPLLVDPFHKDRWDYVYRLSPGYGPLEQRHVTVLFQDGKLSRLEGDVVAASGKPGVAEPVLPRVIDITAPDVKK